MLWLAEPVCRMRPGPMSSAEMVVTQPSMRWAPATGAICSSLRPFWGLTMKPEGARHGKACSTAQGVS